MQTRPLLLIADDDPDDQFLIREAIEFACHPGIEIFFVWDGVEVIEYLQEKIRSNSLTPNLVILDINMPRKDGRAVLEEINADPDLAHIPVAVFTTSTNPVDAIFCQQQGVVGYYRKPSSINELREIVGQLCMRFWPEI